MSGDIDSDVPQTFCPEMNMDSETLFQTGLELFEAGDKSAFAKLEQASSLGHHLATLYLAECLWEGDLVRRSRRKSIEYYKKLAEMGDLQSLLFLAHYYHDRKWVPGSEKRAQAYIRMIAESEPDGESDNLIMSAAKIMSTIQSHEKDVAAEFQSKYEEIKTKQEAEQGAAEQPATAGESK